MKKPRHLVDPDGLRRPIKLDSTSNGEFLPEPHFRTRGPKTRRDFMNLLGWNGGSRA